MASANAGAKEAQVTINGMPVGTFTLTRSDGWQSWYDVEIKNIEFNSDAATLRITMNSSSFNLNYLVVNEHVPGNEQPGEGTMKLLNWNIYYQNNNTQGVARVISEVDPDVVGLCEFMPNADQMVRDLNNASGRSFRVQPGRPWRHGYGTDIFYDANKFDALAIGTFENETSHDLQMGDTHSRAYSCFKYAPM